MDHCIEQKRIGALKGDIEFLEVCGFEKSDDGEFLFLFRDNSDKVDMAMSNSNLIFKYGSWAGILAFVNKCMSVG